MGFVWEMIMMGCLSIDEKIIGCTPFSNADINHLQFHVGLYGGHDHR